VTHPFIRSNQASAILIVRSCARCDSGSTRIQGIEKTYGGVPSHSINVSAKSFIRINDRIPAREIRVIDESGEQIGSSHRLTL